MQTLYKIYWISSFKSWKKQERYFVKDSLSKNVIWDIWDTFRFLFCIIHLVLSKLIVCQQYIKYVAISIIL